MRHPHGLFAAVVTAGAVGGIVTLGLGGCFSGPIPEQAIFTCTGPGECPPELTCAEEVGVCVPPPVLALPGPALLGDGVISPPLARAGVTVTVTFTVDQALAADPVVALEGTALTFGVVEDGTSRVDNRYVFAGIIDGAVPPDGAISVIATVTSKAGRPGALRLGSLTIDRTPNRIDGAFVVTPDSGAVGVGGTATLSFRVLEAVDDAHRPRVFFDDDTGTAWTLQQGDGTAFTFASTVADPPAPPEGEYEVRVVLLDNAGNEGAVLPAGVIRIDATAPTLIERAIGIDAAADSGADLRDDDVSAAGPGATVTVSFTSDEPLGDVPVVEVRCGGTSVLSLARRETETATRFFTFQGVVPVASSSGDCVVVAAIVDEAQNASTVDIGPLIIDVTAPAPIVADDGSGAVLARAPWGAVDLDNDGEADRGARVLVDDTGDVGVIVVAFDPATGGVLTRAPMGEPLDLGGLDRREVEVAAVDAAGNVSLRRRVVQGLWAATLGDKVPGSLAENPHRAVAHRTLPLTLDDEAGLELGPELAGVDGVVAEAAAVPRWRTVSHASADRLARVLPSAVWDDARGVAVAFGGASIGVPADDTLEYDGANWSEVARGPRPPARTGAAMAYDARRGAVVMFGGGDIANRALADTWELDGVWRRRDGAGPPARRDTQAAYDPLRDEVILFGGRAGDGTFLADTWAWDGTSWTNRTPTGPGPVARARAGMTFDPVRGRVLLYGGLQSVADDKVWAWDGATWSIVPLSGTPSPISPTVTEHRLVFDPVRRQVVVVRMNTVQQFENLDLHVIGSSSWTTLPATIQPRAASVWFFDPIRSELVIAGGQNDVTEVLPNGASAFSPVDVGPGDRDRQAAAFDPRTGAVILAGGRDTVTRQPDTWRFDGQRFRLVNQGLPAIDNATAATVGADVILFGGVVNNVGQVNQLRRWNGTTWANVAVTGTVPTARDEAAMVTIEGTATTVLFGGLATTTPSAETFTLTGTVWTRVVTRTAPPARLGHAVAFDRHRDGVILFGGDSDNGQFSVSPLEDTWLFKDGVWTELSDDVGRGTTGTGPTARGRHRMATDPLTGTVLLFGGEVGQNVPNNELWELRDDGWHLVDAAEAPPPSFLHSFVADPNKRHVVLSGGTGRSEAFVLDRAPGGHPAVVVAFDLGPIGLAGVELEEVEASVIAGATGSDPDAGSIDGAELFVWQSGVWGSVGASSSSSSLPAALGSGPLDPFDVAFRDRAVHIAVAARAENGADSARVVVDDAVVRVRYRLGGAR